MIKLFSPRLTYLIGFIIVCISMGATAYLQTHYGITPCPLCILQRIVLALLGIVFFFGATLQLKKVGRIFFDVLASAFATMGVLLAGRQVWLQHMPSQGTDCGASLQYMLQALPLNQVLQKVFAGSAECSRVDWRFLSLSLAEWSLICFVVLLFIAVLQLVRVFFAEKL